MGSFHLYASQDTIHNIAIATSSLFAHNLSGYRANGLLLPYLHVTLSPVVMHPVSSPIAIVHIVYTAIGVYRENKNKEGKVLLFGIYYH